MSLSHLNWGSLWAAVTVLLDGRCLRGSCKGRCLVIHVQMMLELTVCVHHGGRGGAVLVHGGGGLVADLLVHGLVHGLALGLV